MIFTKHNKKREMADHQSKQIQCYCWKFIVLFLIHRWHCIEAHFRKMSPDGSNSGMDDTKNIILQ